MSEDMSPCRYNNLGLLRKTVRTSLLLLLGEFTRRNMQLTTHDALDWDIGLSMADKIKRSKIRRANLDQFISMSRLSANKASRMMDNFWFEQTAEPGEEARENLRGEADVMEATEVLTNVIPESHANASRQEISPARSSLRRRTSNVSNHCLHAGEN